ncbi:MAG TPA: hypothetical protein VFQ91_10050 [Bryobacteraceae bacterium]|nr:hypothetical protein [Bryobacteraceae bacterium]
MHRDYTKTGPMAGLGFSNKDMEKYNFTDQELMDNFSPMMGDQIGRKRDELINARLIWQNVKRLVATAAILATAILWWLLATNSEQFS